MSSLDSAPKVPNGPQAKACGSVGANDVGSIMIEENVMSTAGAHNTATRENLLTVIEEAGFTPAQRDTLYQTFRRIA